MYRIWKNPYFLFVLILSIGSMVLISQTFPGRSLDAGAPPILLRLLTPLESAVFFFSNNLSEGRQKISDWFLLNEELERLRVENKELRVKQLILEDLHQENIRLRQLLNFKEERTDLEQAFAAEVIGRNPSQWFESVTIDRGLENGVSEGMVVVNGHGLVGRVNSVSNGSASVRLLTDPNSGVGVSVHRSREQGVVVGQLGSNQVLLVRFFSPDVDVRVGDEIVTSGLLSQQFPPGIPVGIVMEVQDDAYGLVKQATLQPWVDFDQLDELLVFPFESFEKGTSDDQ